MAALALSASTALWAGACGSSDAGAVLGVETGLRPGVDFDAMDVVLSVDDEPVVEERYTGGELGFPFELRFPALEEGAALEAHVRASFGRTLVVERTVASTAVEGRTLLLRAPLEAACAGALAPTCADGTTCVAGACADPYRDPSEVEDYAAGWAAGADDVCSDGGEPTILLGQGQADYFPLTDGQVLQVEAGPQGGHHVWIAARMKNLRSTNTVTELSGRFEALGYDAPPYSVVFRLQRDEGGFCKIYGLRFQVDGPDMPIESLLGQELDLRVVATDPDGASATAQARIRLSDDVL